jgi:predicted N-acyltransferase
VRIEVLAGDAIEASLAPTLYRIYLATIRRNPWGRRYLNRRVFELWIERLRHRMCCIVARQGSEIVAGTVNFQKGPVFYGRYWGALRELRHLHFNVCYYAGIEHCIRAGLLRFEPGAGGDYKQLRGFDAQATWSVHHLADGRLAAAVSRFLDAERRQAERAIGWLRDHSALREPGAS